MQFNEILEKTKYAFEHNEVFELLMGKKEYAYQAHQFPFTVPTCDEYIFKNGIFPFYTGSNNNERAIIMEKLKNTLQKMLFSENEIAVWWAFSILQGQKDYECYFKISPFVITDEFWSEVKNALAKNRKKLEKNTSFLGCNHANGLWGEIERINRFLISDYNIDVLYGEANG